MKRKVLALALALGLGLNAHCASVTDLLKLLSDYDVAKTLIAISNMAGDDNVGMEVFRSSGLKGSLYCSGRGVDLVDASSSLSRKLRVEGFYGGNFDLTLSYNGVFTPESTEIAAREQKPDGTAVDYPGATLTLTPCLVLLDVLYVPISELPLMGYTSSADATGLHNLCFNAVEIGDATEYLLSLIPQETLVALIKAAINSQVENETIQELIGTIIDRVITDDSDAAYLSLLEGAKLNAMKLTITKADGTTESETFDGYELHSIAATTTVTDRLAATTKLASVPRAGYATIDEATDATRTYRIAALTDSTGTLSIYNFNNAGLAIHTSLKEETTVDDSTGVATTVKRFHNTLQPVSGEFESAWNHLSIVAQQQTGSNPIVSHDLCGGNLGVMNTHQLVGATRTDSKIRPSWSASTIGATLTPGSPTHQGDNAWSTSQGGALQTMSNSLDVVLDPYIIDNSNYSTTLGCNVSLYTFSAPAVYDTRFVLASTEAGADLTHDVELQIEAYRMSDNASSYGSDGIWLKGSLEQLANADYVEGYDLLIMPQTVEDVTKPYESIASNTFSVYKLDADHGLQYRYYNGKLSTSSWLTPLELDATYDLASGRSADLTFEKFVPYADMTKMTASTKWGITTWSEAVPTQDDAYTLFVRTRYTEASALEPTYHALYNIDIDNESTSTALGSIATSSLRIVGEAGAIAVSGAEPTTEVTVVAAGGALVATQTGDGRITLPAGFYLVRANGQTVKVVVK